MIVLKRFSFILPLIVLFLFSVFLPTIVSAEISWKPANQVTVTWSAVMTVSSGADIPTEDIIKYRLYIVKDGDDVANAVGAGETEAFEFAVTFTNEGKWLIGVQAVRVISGEPDITRESAITWSNSIDTIAVPVPFGVVFFAAPVQAVGFGLE